MIEIRNILQISNLSRSYDISSKKTTTEDFEKVLEQLEASYIELDDDEETAQTLLGTTLQSQSSLESDMAQTPIEIAQVTAEETNGSPTYNEHGTQDLQTMNTENYSSQDVYAFDAVLDNLIPLWFSPGGTSAAHEISFVGSSVMTLHEFTSLLEQGWLPKSTDESQIWHFSLQDLALPVSQIVLKKDNVSKGTWTVLLKPQAGSNTDEAMVLQQLQQLRFRLEKINNRVNNIEMMDEFA